jgi:Flp pilus assembly protein TadD
MTIKCPSCGASVSDYDNVCSYCGSNNSEYRSPDRETIIMMGEGMEAFRNGQYATAIRSFIQVTDIAPEVFDAHVYLSASHSALNRPEEALKSMEQAQTLRPGSAPIYYNLAILCKQVGRKDEAKKYLEQALLISKTDTVIPDRKGFEKRVKKELAEYKRWKLF